ncbi:hypothetical protein A9W95_01740 [Mycobacterium sp. 1423905.2]|nr:hypothetical protein A9W95_01740 [Mycobacterium sp. 1423905.2]
MVAITSAGVVVAAGVADPTARARDFQTFQVPSGNIYCGIGMSDTTAFAACEIRDHDWAAPPRPSSCTLDWGDRVALDQGSGPQWSCHGDTIQDPAAPVLGYGQARVVQAITCHSEVSGLTCTDSSTGHFFRLARDGYDLH